MQCDICFRTGGHKLPFLCPTDARNQLYELRVQTAGIHLEKDAIDREISRRCPLPLSKAERSSNETSATITQLDHDALISERERIIDRTNQIIAHADELKANLERAKEERNKKKIANDRRKAELTSASKGIEARRTKQIEAVEGSTQRTKYRWNQTYDFVGESRAYLCYESANLYGLQRFKASNGGEEYRIAGVNIVDLRLMNSTSSLSYTEIMLIMVCSGKPSPNIYLLGSHRACPHASYLLSRCSVACRDNTSSSRLSSSHDILFIFVVHAYQCTISWWNQLIK